MPKSTAANYGDTLRKYADEYFKETGVESAGSGDIATWALQTSRWEPPHDVVFKLCREHFARAMREDYTTDANGRPVRLKHAARIKRGDEQLTLWADIRKAPREHMVAAFQQRRQQIVGDCCQLKRDEDYFNSLHPDAEPHQTIFDFSEDVAEAMYVEGAE